MRNKDIAPVFRSIADIMEILGEDPFRIGSYRKAARAATAPWVRISRCVDGLRL